MYRRLLSSHLKTLTSSLSPPRSPSSAAAIATAAPPSLSSLSRRHFSDDTSAVKKKVEDVLPIATGHEREEIQAQLEGRDILEINYPEGPFGTKEEPAVVKSYYDKRIVGCPGGEDGEFSLSISIYLCVHDSPQVDEKFQNFGYSTDKVNTFFIAEDEHDVVWFWLEKGKPHECPVCSQYFVLEVVGPGGPPDGHGDDDHHH
ncbi:hypothetical protein Lal_00017744 [Lupinus albus]|nr:hypothetical protein Lal_00017744 [Lupinus albus]